MYIYICIFHSCYTYVTVICLSCLIIPNIFHQLLFASYFFDWELSTDFVINSVHLRLIYRISPPISPGLICVPRAFLVGLSAGGLSMGELIRRGAYTRCKKMFSEKMIHNSRFASLNSESNIIFDNNLTAYDQFITRCNTCFFVRKP